MMMNKSKSSTLKLAKYLLMLPMFVMLIAANSVYAIDNNQSFQEPSPPPPPVKIAKTNDVFVVVEEQPVYPGGVDAMMKFLTDNIKYPFIALENGSKGTVICTFVIEKDGSVSDVKVIRGLDPSMDKEAIRVIEQMPKWKPGMQRGNAVNVRYTLPVTFKLTSEPI